jgi:hypothetical protein
MPRTKSGAVDWDSDEERIYVKNQAFADLAGLSKSWVCRAAKEDYLAGGMPVAQWKVEDRYGRTVGFDVPKSVFEGLKRSQKYA